jgi:hypothetical protein
MIADMVACLESRFGASAPPSDGAPATDR